MSRYDDLIEALNRNTEAMERERADREAERARQLAHARTSLCRSSNQLNQRRTAYGFSKGGNLLGTALLPVGLLLTAGSMLTGGAIAPAIGIAGAAVGAVLKLFLCSQDRVNELEARMRRAEQDYQNDLDYLNSL